MLNELGMEDLVDLNKDRYVLHYQKGELIYKKGRKPSGLLCLSEGKVKITIPGINGEEHIISLKKPVDFIGLNDLMRDDHYTASALALEECAYLCDTFTGVFQIGTQKC